MLKRTAIGYFKSGRAIATALELSTVAVFKWGEVIPYWAAERCEEIARGEIKVRRELYARGRPLKGKQLRAALRAGRAVHGEGNDNSPAIAR
jgi:hypothetical protein